MTHAGGRPVLYKTSEDMQKIIDEYFEWCDNRGIKTVNSEGKEYMVSSPAPYTMSGLARRLGMSRQSLINYLNKDEFFDTIKAARSRIEEDVETRLMEGKNQSGAIFNLKNNFEQWLDKRETEISGKDGGGIVLNLVHDGTYIPKNGDTPSTPEGSDTQSS